MTRFLSLTFFITILMLLCNQSQGRAANTTKDNEIIWGIAHYPPRFVIEAQGRFSGQAGLQHEILESALPAFQHVYRELNYANFISMLLNKENVCSSMVLKTKEREQFAVFSIPWHIDLPIAISITREAWQRIGAPEEIKFEELIGFPNIKGGIEKKRSYGKLDSFINDASLNTNLDSYDLIVSQILPLLQTGGIDYTIEYPYLATYYLKSINNQKDILSVPLSDSFAYTYGYIACTKNDWGQSLINKLNTVIAEERAKPGYLSVLQMLYGSKAERQKIADIYHQYFLASQ